MSGLVGIVHFDGAPVDRHLLRRMTGFMAFRGPDAQEIRLHDNAGFGHTLLKTTDEAEHESQPFTLDGGIWVVADARVDARTELIAKLDAKGQQNLSPDATDTELILRAYLAWDQDCVDHLLGDFVFAIWDGRKQRLFCARDHLGVKPFYYAHLGQKVIFSNTLDCIRQHPAVSERLNDLAIADFLLFELNQDQATTSFADIQRIPPAHTAKWSAGGMHLRRYWSLPIDEPVYFRKDHDYIDRFHELLDRAVDDRLRTKKIGVFITGGLDSPALAATACRIMRSRSPDSEVCAFTTVIDSLDRNETYHASLAAEHLGIPIHFRDLSDGMCDPAWAEGDVHTAEPLANPLYLVSNRKEYQAMASYSRVWFYGEGPDNALRPEWPLYLSYLIRQRHFGRLPKTAWELVTQSCRIPFLCRLRRPFKGWWSGQPEQSPFPEWLNRDFASRLCARGRWGEIQDWWSEPGRHPLRPQAYRSFEHPRWEDLLSQCDAEAMGVAAEVRHPFADIRLLRYLLAVPAIPWARDKYLVRRALRGVLPGPVLSQPKSALSSDLQWEAARRVRLAPLLPNAGLEKYVDPLRVPDRPDEDMMTFRVNLRPRALNYWLGNMQRKAHEFETLGPQSERLSQTERGQKGKKILKTAG
jgi:asparagine synthase (glutamine-hydrolysing)